MLSLYSLISFEYLRSLYYLELCRSGESVCSAPWILSALLLEVALRGASGLVMLLVSCGGVCVLWLVGFQIVSKILLGKMVESSFRWLFFVYSA